MATFHYMQQLCENHNDQLQNLLRTQPTHVGDVNLILTSIATLLFLCENNTVVEKIQTEEMALSRKILEFLAESCYGPCSMNQETVVGSDAIVAIRNIINAPTKGKKENLAARSVGASSDDEVEKLDEGRLQLKLGAIGLLFATLEGRTDDRVARILSENISAHLLLKFSDELANEAKAKVEGNRKDKQENRQEYIELLDGVAKIASITRAISQVNGRFDDSNYEALATHTQQEEVTMKSERLR